MDIFTTQLTRVVPVPIKPASLKVKALLKEAANTKLTQDPDHLENHEYYFTSDSDEYHANKEDAKQESKNKSAQKDADEHIEADSATPPASDLDKSIEDKDDKGETPKHLDLYV
jgi:hypothetical protein